MQNTIFTIASGKGGVGKTSFTLNLATLLSKRGLRVLVVDGDTGLANADVQLNLAPTADLSHVLSGSKSVQQALTPTPQGFQLLAGRAGHRGLATLTGPQLDELFAQLLPVSSTFDITLIDAAAGVTPLTLSLCARARTTLLVATPDPSSYVDAFALIKLLYQSHNSANAQLVMNQASVSEATSIHRRISLVMENSLRLPPLPLLATIPTDRVYATALRQHKLAAESYPQCAAVNAIRQLAEDLATTLEQRRAV